MQTLLRHEDPTIPRPLGTWGVVRDPKTLQAVRAEGLCHRGHALAVAAERIWEDGTVPEAVCVARCDLTLGGVQFVGWRTVTHRPRRQA